jgi:hypothetical protein
MRVADRPRRALTLLEVVISLSLMVLLLGALLTFFWQVCNVRKEAAAHIHRTQIARSVVSKMVEELRSCVGFEQVGFPVEQRLVGDRRGITFLTTNLPARQQYQMYSTVEKPPPAQHDLTLVGYRLWVDPENRDENGEPIVGGVVRSEKRTLNQHVVHEDDPLQIRYDLWSPEIGYLEFRYFDGSEWDTRWDLTAGNSLPQLIQITVGFQNITQAELDDADLKDYPLSEYPYGDDREHADRYTVILRLPAADRFFGSRFQRLGKQLSEQLGVEGGLGL